MKFDLFERVDVALHWAMRSSLKHYRKLVTVMCQREEWPSAWDNWYANRVFQIHSFFKKAWLGHVRKPSKGYALFLVTMDEVFSQAAVLKVLFPFIRIRVGLKSNA